MIIVEKERQRETERKRERQRKIETENIYALTMPCIRDRYQLIRIAGKLVP